MMWVLLILGLYFVFFNMKFSLFTVLVVYFVWFKQSIDPIAQMVEQITFNDWVVGSNPTGIAK